MYTQTYLIYAYQEFAIAASTVPRSVTGACIPFAGRSMHAAMGYGWENSLLAAINLLMLPLP